MTDEAQTRDRNGGLFVGGLLIALGVVFLLDQLGIMDVGELFSTFWPLILIAIGLKMILDRERSQPKTKSETGAPNVQSEALMQHNKVFGDIRTKVTSKDFTGGHVSTVFGDLHLDLTEAGIETGEQVLTLNGVFGDIHVTLPANLKVQVKANIVIGDINIIDEKADGFFVNRTYESEGYANAKKKLYVAASQVIGDIRISQAARSSTGKSQS